MVLLNDNHFIYFLSLVSFLLTETVACCSYYIKELDGKMHEILRQRLSNEAILTPREYLAMSEGIFHCQKGKVLLASSR